MRLRAVFTLLLTLFLLLWSVTTFRSYEHYKIGKEALLKRKYLEAITNFERGALYYAPYNKFFTNSVEELINISTTLKKSDPLFAKQANNAVERIQNQLSLSFVKPVPCFFLIGWFAFMILFFFKGFDLRGKLQPSIALSSFTLSLLFLFLLFLALKGS